MRRFMPNLRELDVNATLQAPRADYAHEVWRHGQAEGYLDITRDLLQPLWEFRNFDLLEVRLFIDGREVNLSEKDHFRVQSNASVLRELAGGVLFV
jgi:hypothetical protein